MAAHLLRRTQPPVVSTASARGFGSAFLAVGDRAGARSRFAAALMGRFGARRVALTDSGTSALVMALRAAAGRGGTVALPAYGCPDLLAAAAVADVRVRLYDLDPATLSADLESVAAVLARGADAIVVTHLFGYASDIEAVAAIAAAHGTNVVEDAAQAAGGRLNGTRLGGFGPLTVLSFGRGKGVSGGGGGALLAFGAAAADAGLEAEISRIGNGVAAGWSALGVTAAQWLLARPSLYGIPASVPRLRLGETVYRPAGEPRPIPASCAGLAAAALQRADVEARRREAVAAAVRHAAGNVHATGIASVPGGHPGYLRLPVRRPGADAEPSLGVLRGYPATLDEYFVARRLLHAGEVSGPGSRELRDALFTAPTHHHVRREDVARIAAWLRNSGQG